MKIKIIKFRLVQRKHDYIDLNTIESSSTTYAIQKKTFFGWKYIKHETSCFPDLSLFEIKEFQNEYQAIQHLYKSNEFKKENIKLIQYPTIIIHP